MRAFGERLLSLLLLYAVFDKHCLGRWRAPNDKNNICKGKRWGGATRNCADIIAEEVGGCNAV